ncbi:zinc ribbon domain-containing protein, partial [Desulfovirgula thermocuniculi]|uniref:zinc ribbon domain-containing protein n=1 Tax=Desulfovirgula thermocuniculi TaxID=348842 RepID=UPI000555E407
AVSTLTPGERVVIPLAGVHAVEGNLRVVLLPDERAVEVHISFEPAVFPAGDGEAGIDLGVTEVFTDDTGRKYRAEYGKALQKMSDYILDKGRKRQKLWALYRRNLERDPARARRIRRHNLGLAKQRKRHLRFRRRCENEINRAFNEFLKARRPRVVAYEDLSRLRGKAGSRGLSRIVSLWMRRITGERWEYKSYVYSVEDPGPVNAAYSSLTCPVCGWVDPQNREGDTFRCRKCGFTAGADQVAAMNLKARLHDEEITRYTPKNRVKEILLRRYYGNNAV